MSTTPLHESRELLKTAQTVDRPCERPSRDGRQLEEAYQQAEVPLIQAVQGGHEFVYNTLRERLAVARQRLEALVRGDRQPQSLRPHSGERDICRWSGSFLTIAGCAIPREDPPCRQPVGAGRRLHD